MPEKKKKEPKVFHVRVKLEGDLAKRFNIVKRYHGFENNTDLARMLFNKEFERLSQRDISVIVTPDFEYFNTYEDHVTIRDHRLGLYVDVYPKPDGKLHCSYHKSLSCEHTKFILNTPEILEKLRKKGWEYKAS